MPLSEKLDKGFESLVDTLFGSGQQEYYKGGLMRSRIGANEALTGHRLAQTRDLDYAHEQKQNLIRALTQRENPRMLQGFQSGDTKNFVEADILNADALAKVLAMERIRERNPNQADYLDVGESLHGQALANRLDLLGPEEKNKLIAEQTAMQAKTAQEGALNEANINLRNQQRNTSGALMGQYQQQTSNLMMQGLMDFDTGVLNLQKIQATMGHDAAESAGRINKLKSEKAELDKKFQLANEKLIQLQAEGINYKKAMEHMAKIPIATASDGTTVTYADMVAVGAAKEGSKAVIGGSQIGGTAGLQVSQNVMDQLLKDQDSIFEVPVTGDKSGKKVKVTFADGDETQKEIIFNRRLKIMIDAMAEQMGIHPNQRQQWKQNQTNIGKKAYQDSKKQDKVSKKLKNGDKRTRKDIFNNFQQGVVQPMSSNAPANLNQRLNQLSGYENVGSKTMDQLLAEGNVGTTAANPDYAANPMISMPTGGSSYLENLKRSHPEAYAKLSAAQLAQFGATARR